MSERLQKFLSQAGVASRRQAEKMIVEGRVKVNGTPVTELGTQVSNWDAVYVDGKKVGREAKTYVLFYKPKGVVTTLADPEGRSTIRDYIRNITQRVVPVGRLDYNTEGLLLLTNDGELTNLLTHPRHHVEKTYKVVVLGIPSDEKLDKLRIGIKLEDGVTAPAKIYVIAKDVVKGLTTLEMIIAEGKNRQIRRMCEIIGHPVRNLKRTKLAFLTLQGLKRGQYRLLAEEEIAELYALARSDN